MTIITHKKTALLLFLLCAALAALSAGGSTQRPSREIPKDAPSFVKDAAKKAPKDAYIGIGKAENSGSPAMAQMTAEARARTSLARQIGVTEHDEEKAGVSFVSARLTNAVIIGEGIDSKGNFWAVIMLSGDDARGADQ